MGEGEPLTGDGVTQGIVRIGDTVRRPLRPFSLTVQAYLAHLRDTGFTGAPLPFGVDEQGREVLSFVPGDVPRNPLPPETAGDDVLIALARLIRRLHEAARGGPGDHRAPQPAGLGGRDGLPGTVDQESGESEGQQAQPGTGARDRRWCHRRRQTGHQGRRSDGDQQDPERP